MGATKMGLKTKQILLALWTPQVFAQGDAAVTVADEGELISLDGSILLSGSFCFGKLKMMMIIMEMVEESLVGVVREGVEDPVRISYYSVGTFFTLSVVLSRQPLHPLMKINCCILDWF